MGIYLNPSADGFASIMKTGDYVDKTGLLEYTNSVLNTTCGIKLFQKYAVFKQTTKIWKILCCTDAFRFLF